MKNNKYFIYFALLILIGFVSCKKDDGPIKKSVLDLIDAVPVISTAIDASGSQSIDMINLATFAGKVKVSMYFDNAALPEKVDLVVRKNNQTGTNVKVFKSGVTVFPSTFSITANDIQTLFGTPITLGDNYDFSADIYANGKKYEAFPSVGVGSGSGPNGMPGYSNFARFGAICAYNPDVFQGNFEVVSDAFEDTYPGDIIALTKIDNTHFSYNYPSLLNGKPIIVTVNPLNNAVTIAQQTVGTKFTWSNTYTNPTIAASGTGNYVAPCDKTLYLRVSWSVTQGGFGAFDFVLKKVE